MIKNMKKIIWFLCSLAFLTIMAMEVPQIVSAEETQTFTGASGKSGDLEWNITQEGHLTVTGDGDYETIDVRFADDNSKHLAPEWLKYCRDIKTAELDIKNITYTGYMFYRCRYLTNINIINFDTSKVTSMECMFFYCTKLVDLDVSDWDTSNVTSMAWMFFCCGSQKSLDVSKWDTSNVKYMEHFFQDNGYIEDLDVSKWDTGNVVNMSCMFFNCSRLTNLDVSSFDTHNVKDMSSMFYGCNSLTHIDVSNWNTSKVTTLQRTFCCGLTSIDVSNWDVSSLSHIDVIFGGPYEEISMFANAPFDVELPASKGYHWENENGRICTVMPKGLPVKMTYKKVIGDTTDINPIMDILPDLNNLGKDEIKGPEINIGNNTFNLFKISCNVSLPIFNNEYLKIKINKTEHTAEILIGLKDDIKTDTKNDPYWKETYKEVKSLVKACGGKVDTTELWNKFSKLRGKLKKFDGNAVFKVSGDSAGYIKLQLDKNNIPIGLVEGGVVAKLTANAATKTPLWGIIYSEFGVKGIVNGKLCLNTGNTKVIPMQGEVGLALKPSFAIGADVVVLDVKGGIEGEIGGKVSIPWTSFEECVNAWLSGRLFIEFSTIIPNLEGTYEFNFPKLELYPELGKIEQKSLNLQYKSRSIPTKEQYNEIQNYAGNSVDVVNQSIVYENAKPDMIELPDGRILMVYLDDTVEGANGQAKLMYRLYNNGHWSEQKIVNNNMNLDTAGKLCIYNGTAYVVYENSNRAINEGIQQEDILNALDLYVASFDVSSDVFQTPTKLGEVSGKESTWKYGYDFVKDETSFSVIWAKNSAGDILLGSGDTEFYESKYINDTWQEKSKIQSQSGAVQEFCYLRSLENSGLFYVKDGVLYKDGVALENADNKIDSVKIFDKNLYFRKNGQLCQLNGTEINTFDTYCTTNYRVLNGIVYWTEQSNFTSEIYQKDLSSEKNPVAITNDGGYIGSFSVINYNNEKPFFSYTVQAVDTTATYGNPYGLTVLKSTGDFSRTQAEILNLSYDILSYRLGESNDIAITISNTGTVDLTNVKIVIYDTKGNIIHDEKISDKLDAGIVLEKHLSVLIPDNMSEGEITVLLQAEQEFDNPTKAEKKLKLETDVADICLERKDNDTVVIKNNGITAKNVTINVMDKNESGNIVLSNNIGTLNSGEIKEISIAEAWNSASLDESFNKKYLYCEVSQDAVEYSLWDNTLQLEKEYDKVEPIEPVEDYNTGIYKDISNMALATISERTLFVNGSNVKQADNTKINFKSKTYYTNLQASNITTTDKKGKLKTKKGKLVVGITDSKDTPILIKGKFPKNTSINKIANASISKGKIKVNARSVSGEVYLWVVDTGDAKASVCAKIYVKAAPSIIQIFDKSSNAQDFSYDKKNIYKKDNIELGSSTKLYIYPTYKSNGLKTKTEDATYNISVDKKVADCFKVVQDENNPNCFIVKAVSIKNNKKTKGKVTIKCNENGKKAVFSATAVNSVQDIKVDSLSGLTMENINTKSMVSTMKITVSEIAKTTGNFTLATTNSDNTIMTTDKPKLYAMGSENGFDIAQMKKGKVKITSKPSANQKKLTARFEQDKKTVTVTAARRIPAETTVYYLIVYNTVENKGYKIVKMTAVEN